MKMEGIELYPHNQKAYDNLCAMLRDSNRACVVQPTGTGKFVIIAKMAQDNPGKNFLLLGTNDYMYIDQMANLSDIAPGFTPKNLQFMTYATAMAKAKCGDDIPRCDVIVADEFHHCGAPEWGKGVHSPDRPAPSGWACSGRVPGMSCCRILYHLNLPSLRRGADCREAAAQTRHITRRTSPPGPRRAFRTRYSYIL